MAECTPVLLHLPSRSRLMTLGTNADLVVFEVKQFPRNLFHGANILLIPGMFFEFF